MAKKMAAGACGPRCIIMGLLSAAFAAGGVWMVIAGIMRQWSATVGFTNVWLWYFGAFILFCIGKCMKFKACATCKAM